MAFKVKFRTLFPALATASSPLSLVKTGLAYVFSLDITALRQTLDPIYLVTTLTNIILSGSTSGTVTVKAPAVAGTNIVTLPAATDTLVGKSTTDTLSNKIIVGTATNDSAPAGAVGEYVSSLIATGSALALTNGTAKTITSISLTAGDWDISGVIGFLPTGTTNTTQYIGSISQTTDTLDATPGRLASFNLAAYVPGAAQQNFALPVSRVSIASTTTFYLIAQAGFTVSTLVGFGLIAARRRR